jgi:LssY C-terminus
MARLFKCSLKSAALAVLTAAQAWPLQLPAGTEMQIRLKSKVGSKISQPNDPIEAEVIAPVMLGKVYAIPAGAAVHGLVVQAQPSTAEQRAILLLRFTRVDVGGAPVTIVARVTSVDNAREKVDDQGQINGVLASETATGKVDAELGKLSDKLGGLGNILSNAANRVTQKIDQDMAFDAGVEMTLSLTAPAILKAPGGPGPLGKLKPVTDRAALAALAVSQPFQTVAQKPPRNSDLTNLVLIGSKQEVEQAFADAGWHAAASLNPFAKFETLEALAEDKGFNEAPVSVLFLEGKPPDIVFEKLNDTFARRHHLRIWLRPDHYQGRPVWVVAATHDMGINFSAVDRTFIHRVDPSIDRERDKVVNDLIYSGHVASMLLVDRAAVPQHAQNATGDNLVTDGKIAVLLLTVGNAQ